MRECAPRLKLCETTLTTWPHRARWLPNSASLMRGDIYRLKASRNARGREQAGARYAVVVQSDDLPLSTWLIAPTSTGRRSATFRPEIELAGQSTRVLVEQLTVVDPQVRLGEFIGRLTAAEAEAVDRALLAVLALD